MAKKKSEKPKGSSEKKKSGYFFGTLKKIALFPLLGGKNSPADQPDWDKIDPFHHRPNQAFT